MVPSDRRALGRAGEQAAAAWYESEGFTVAASNWRCPDGELDLVLERAGLLVFCEVKTRRSTRFGAPIEAVTSEKARRVRQLAARYLREHAVRGAIRFDVASVVATGDGTLQVDVMQEAF